MLASSDLGDRRPRLLIVMEAVETVRVNGCQEWRLRYVSVDRQVLRHDDRSVNSITQQSTLHQVRQQRLALQPRLPYLLRRHHIRSVSAPTRHYGFFDFTFTLNAEHSGQNGLDRRFSMCYARLTAVWIGIKIWSVKGAFTAMNKKNHGQNVK